MCRNSEKLQRALRNSLFFSFSMEQNSDDDSAVGELPRSGSEDSSSGEEEGSTAKSDAAQPAEIVRAFCVQMAAAARQPAAALDACCAIPALLGVASAEAPTITILSALQTLNRLLRARHAASAAHRGCALDAGAVPLLTTQLRAQPGADAAEMQPLISAAAQALCHLGAGTDPDCANRVRLGGAVQPLVDGPLARCGAEPEAAAWAAGALAHVAAANSAGRAALVASDRCLIHLVRVLDYAVPFDVTTDSASGAAPPSAQHRRAAVNAGGALAAVMSGRGEEGEAVAAAVIASLKTSPRLGHSISAASKPLLTALQHAARVRMHMAQSAGSPAAMAEAIAFARAVKVPKGESGAARHRFNAAHRTAEDKRKQPWRFASDGTAHAHSQHSQHSPPPPHSPRSPRRAGSPPPHSPRSASPPPPPRTASPLRNASRLDAALLRADPDAASAASAASDASPRPPCLRLPLSPSHLPPPSASSERSAGSKREHTTHHRQGHAAARADAPPAASPSPSRGLSAVLTLDAGGDAVHTGAYALRSRSPSTSGLGRTAVAVGAGLDALESVAGRAEAQMDSCLAGVRALLSDSLSELQRRHEEATATLRAENRKLQQALASARARESQLEERLRKAGQLMSHLCEN